MIDIFGYDIALDGAGQARVAINGELLLVSGTDTAIQDIILRLNTYIGTLFYDVEFGSRLPDWVYDDNSELGRIGFAAEVTRRLNEEPGIQPGSVYCEVSLWDDNAIVAETSFGLIGTDHTQNLVIQFDKKQKKLVVNDVKPKIV